MRMQDLQVQLSSGQKAMRYSGIAADTSRLINLESNRTRSDQYISNNNTLNLRLQTMEQSVANSFDIASQLKTLLVNAINGQNATDLPVNLTAQNMMDQLSGDLNIKLGDRYLFSGTQTGTPPVDFDDVDFTSPPDSYPSNADTSYYQGDSTRLTAQVADNFDVNWGVTADEQGFEQLIRALHLTATATTSPTVDTNRLQEALSVVNQAIDNIPNIRSRIAASQLSIQSATDSHNNLNLYVDETISNIKSVDVTQAVTQLSTEQTLMQASLMTVSRLSQLSLANYLN
jgi:flagellar hook-associated protein 3 FlgL